MSEKHFPPQKTRFSSLVRFPWKKFTKRTSRANSSSSISKDVQNELLLKGRPFRRHSGTPVLKRAGKNRKRKPHASGRRKGHTDRGTYLRHFKNDKRNNEKHQVAERSSESYHKTIELEQLQEDSNSYGVSNLRSLKRPKLSDVHNPNFRIRLYRELNVVSKPINSTFKTASRWSRSKPITMNKEQILDRRGIDKEGKSSIIIRSTRQSMDSSDDEDIFALDI